MKIKQLADALGALDEGFIAEYDAYKPRRTRLLPRLCAAVLCVCLAVCGGVGAVRLLDREAMSAGCEQLLRLTLCRVGDRLAFYTLLGGTDSMSFTASLRLESRVGEKYADFAGALFYRVKGGGDLSRLIMESTDGDGKTKYTLTEFYEFARSDAETLEDSYYYKEGILNAENTAGLVLGPYTLGEVLREVYSVRSPSDIARAVLRKADFDNSRVGEQVRVPTVTLKGDELDRLFSILSGLSTDSTERRAPTVFAENNPDRLPLGIQTSRTLDVIFKNGSSISLRYDPTDGSLSLAGRPGFGVISDADNEWLYTAARVDFEYREYPAPPSVTGGVTASAKRVPDESQ